MHKLLIEDDEGKTVAVPLIREEITIGRLDGNTIRLTEQNVSRKHVRLTLHGGVLRIEDLGSYNGTSLNGSPLSGVAALKDGDVILIGDYRLGIQEDKQGQVTQVEAHASSPGMAPPVDAAMEGQPTIPISTLGVSTAFSEPPARLVVSSRFQSGAEFVLDRPSQVIGRTPENDIVLNHKSISRHHAKILRDSNRYTILDLESANGVRVSGVEHDKVELQSGDVIELGEVRLRFLAGDADLYDQPRQGKVKLALISAAGVAVVAGVLLLVFSGGSSSTRKPVAVESKPPVAPLPPPVAPVVQPTEPTPAEPAKPAEPAVPLPDLLAEAKASAQEEKWEEAIGLLDQATARAPDSAEAAQLRKAIIAEQRNGEKIAELKTAFANKEFDTVLQGAAEIPDDSMYKARANELHKSALGQAVALHLGNANAKLADKDCDEAKREAELVLGMESKNKKAAFIIRRCEILAAAPPAAAVPAPAPESKPAVRHPAPVAAAPRAPTARPRAAEPARSEPAPVAAADPDKLIKDAQQAWFRGQYAAAIDFARKALRAKPNLTNAYQIIAVCSCALHDGESAVRAYEKLDDRNKLYVKSACQKNGISF